MIEAAREYLGLGLSVFPVGTDKVPIVEWAAFQTEAPHPDQLEVWWGQWPEANIGCATGRVSNLVVLDADGVEGFASLRALDTPATTWLSRTGRLEGGYQQFFAHPGPRIGNRARLRPGLDVRGDGGYVILPPSLHASGRRYEWRTSPQDLPLAPLPEAVLKLLLDPDGGERGRGPRATDVIIPQGVRNDHLYRAARALRSRGLGAEALAAALLAENRARCRPPLPDEDVREIARHAATQPDRADFAGGPREAPTSAAPAPYIETLAAFLAEADPPLRVIFPDLLPSGVIMLLHGEPRARKSLAAFELALAAATGTPPFGLDRFLPSTAINVLYIQEEDPRQLTRTRLRRIVHERCGAAAPDTLHVAVRRGVDLDDPHWVERLIVDLVRLDARLLVLDAARRLSTKTDEGPAKVRELMATLRSIVTRAGVTIVVAHHDIKPPTTGQDLRRRGQRASGGDWFAGCECPVHVERVNERESLVYPQDYKFSADPAPFTFSCHLDGRLIDRLVGQDTTTDRAETAGQRGKLLDWLRGNGPASKTAMKKAGFGWETITPLLDGLLRDGTVDATPGRTAKSHLYFVIPEPAPESRDGSPRGRDDTR